MFLAAFTSAWPAKPQAVHRKRAWLSRDLPSTYPHAEHRWLVNAGLTFSTRPGAQLFNADHLESARQIRAGLLNPVLARVRLTRFESGDGPLHPAPSS
jgi:hypothetical protein